MKKKIVSHNFFKINKIKILNENFNKVLKFSEIFTANKLFKFTGFLDLKFYLHHFNNFRSFNSLIDFQGFRKVFDQGRSQEGLSIPLRVLSRALEAGSTTCQIPSI